jgi:hypothetical protein
MYVSKPDVVPLLQYTNLDAVAEGKGGGTRALAWTTTPDRSLTSQQQQRRESDAVTVTSPARRRWWSPPGLVWDPHTRQSQVTRQPWGSGAEVAVQRHEQRRFQVVPPAKPPSPACYAGTPAARKIRNGTHTNHHTNHQGVHGVCQPKAR